MPPPPPIGWPRACAEAHMQGRRRAPCALASASARFRHSLSPDLPPFSYVFMSVREKEKRGSLRGLKVFRNKRLDIESPGGG